MCMANNLQEGRKGASGAMLAAVDAKQGIKSNPTLSARLREVYPEIYSSIGGQSNNQVAQQTQNQTPSFVSVAGDTKQESESDRKKRLNSIRSGISSTIRTPFLASSLTGKKKLG